MTLPWLALACGDDGSSATDATASGTGTATATATGTGTATMSGSATVNDTGSGSMSASGGTVDTTATTTATGTATTTATTTTTRGTDTGDTGATTMGTSGGDTTGTTGGTTGETTGGVCNGQGNPMIEFSYIWISNSDQGTVSKIDTETATEVGRYYSGPVADRDPSRTSVSGDGQFAVVANRDGGLTMIAAEPDNCVDLNNNNMIDTSQGPNDLLPWGTDECVIWNIALPGNDNTGPRPVSWTIGPQNPQTCQHEGGDVWIGWYDQGANTGHFRLVEGMTGNTIDQIQVPNWSLENWGPYGGAIDSDNNFWVIGWGGNGPVVRIDGVTHQATNFGNPGGWIYGMGLDLQGNTWASGCGNGNVYRFHAQNQTWSQVATVPGVSCLRGLQVDHDGVAWIAKNNPCGLAAIDTSVEPPVPIDLDIPLAGCSNPVGVSIDAQGYVWVVDRYANSAFKVDPMTYQVVDQVTGLVGPYTYSDMTGAGIAGQIEPQP